MGVRGQAGDGLHLVHVLVPLGLAREGPLALLDGVQPVVGAVAHEPHLTRRGLADAVEELEVVLEAEKLVVDDTAGALQLRRDEHLRVPQGVLPLRSPETRRQARGDHPPEVAEGRTEAPHKVVEGAGGERALARRRDIDPPPAGRARRGLRGVAHGVFARAARRDLTRPVRVGRRRYLQRGNKLGQAPQRVNTRRAEALVPPFRQLCRRGGPRKPAVHARPRARGV